MNLKCVATAGGLAIGVGAAVFKAVTRRQPSESQVVEPDRIVVEDETEEPEAEPEAETEESEEEDAEETEERGSAEEVFECDEPGCESTFDSEHGLAIHNGKAH